MYTIEEITTLSPISNNYIPTEYPFVVSFKFYYGAANEEIATWWSGAPFSVTEPLTSRVFITGVVYNISINYSEKSSLSNCILDSGSFFWDNTNQILYIHYEVLHHIDYIDTNFDYGVAIGLTNDKIRYFENRAYMPFLITSPEVEEVVDKFNYDKASNIVSTISNNNKSGFFNQFKSVSIYGNRIAIKTGNEGDTYSELVERANYYVEDYNFSADEFTIDVQDIKVIQNAQVPNSLFNDTDYPDIGESNIGKVIPFGYGPHHYIEGICINELDIDGSTYPDFIFLEEIYESDSITVWVLDEEDVWIEQLSGVTPNWSTGVVTINGARTLGSDSTTYGFFKVKADVTGIVNTYASDIIKDLNDRILGITYDSDNYDTTEWESEEDFLEPITLYMKETKDIYEWFTEIQSLSSVGFRYMLTSDNKRTIRVDNPNRDLAFSVPSIHIMNIAKVKAESSIEDVYNTIQIGYNKSIIDDTAPNVEDTTYLDLSFSEFKVLRTYNKASGLSTEVDAINRASIQAEDYQKIRQLFNLTLIGEKYLDLRLYDVIKVNLSLTKKEFIVLKVLVDTIGASSILVSRLSESLIYQEVLTSISVEEVGNEYFGGIHGQITSIRPDYTFQTNSITIRERPYSDIFAAIYP